jgi:hypothetical protein
LDSAPPTQKSCASVSKFDGTPRMAAQWTLTGEMNAIKVSAPAGMT